MNRTRLIRCVLGGAISLAFLWNATPWLKSVLKIGLSRDAETAVWMSDCYIPAYSPISPKQLRKVRWPRAYVPPGALMATENLIDSMNRPRFTAALAIPEGQPLSRALLLDAQSGESIASLLRPGQVAVSFQVDRAKGAGGWVRPGDIVAIFSETLEAAGAKPHLIIPLITVLAVDGKRLTPEAKKPAEDESQEDLIPSTPSSSLVITVRANPLEASALIKASERGSVHLVVRSAGDELPWTAVN